jgi:hypothetical protein
VAQTLSHAVAPGRPDPLELWRVADRVARHAEIRVPQDRVALQEAGVSSPVVEEAVALRRKANDLLRAALGELAPAGREPVHAAQAVGA